MQSSYRGYYLEEGENGVVYVYDSAEAWRERRWVYVGDNEYQAKVWIDQMVGETKEGPEFPKALIPDVTRLISKGEPFDTKKIVEYLDPTKPGARGMGFLVVGYEPPKRGGDTRFFLTAKGDAYGHVLNDAYDAKQRELIEQQRLLERLGLHDDAGRLQPLIDDPEFNLPDSTAKVLLRDGIVVAIGDKFRETGLGCTLYTFVTMTGEFDPQPLSTGTAVTFYDYMLQLYFVLGEGSYSPAHEYDEYVRLADLGYIGMML